MANAQEEEQQLPSNQATAIRMEHYLKASSDTCGTIRSSTTARTTQQIVTIRAYKLEYLENL